MPVLDGKLEDIRISINKALKNNNNKKLSDLWFPNIYPVSHNSDDYFNPIIKDSRLENKRK